MSYQAIYFVFLMGFMGRMKIWKSNLDSSSLYNKEPLSASFFFATPFANIRKSLIFLPKGGHLESIWIMIKTMKFVVCPPFLLDFTTEK